MDPTSASVAAQEDGKSREQILSQAAEAVTRSQNPQLSTSHVFPEGGAEAWAVVFGAWCAMLPPLGLVNSIAVLQGWLSSHELSGISESKIGWIFSCYAFFITAGGAFVGPLVDAHDTHLITGPGSVGMVVSLISLSFSKELHHFLLAFGFCGGISAALLFNPALSVIGHWFCRRRALATGVACTAGGLGGVAFPLIIQYLAPRVGFAWSIRIIALVSFVLLIIAYFTLRKRLSNTPKAKVMIDFRPLRDTNFAITVSAVFFIEFAVFIPYSYISSYGIYSGLTLQKAFLLSVFANLGAIPGRMLPGYVADRIGAFNTMCVTSFCCFLSIFGLWLAADGDEKATTAFSVLFGFWSGAAISLSPVCVSRVCRIEDYGKSNGIAYFFASFGALVGIPIAGALLQTTNNPYQHLIYFAGAAYGVAFVIFCCARLVTGGFNFALV